MRIQLYADGSDIKEIERLNSDPNIEGFTTNPTLMRKAGVVDYLKFVKDVTSIVKNKPISFEVFSDDFEEMRQQAITLSRIADNIYIKIPVTDTKQRFCSSVIDHLLKAYIPINVTAVMTKNQILDIYDFFERYPGANKIISIFAGRIADTGLDPTEEIKLALDKKPNHTTKVLWASPREVYNIYQADRIGCDIITATPDLIAKLSLQNKSLKEYSLDTVKMFYNDAVAAGYKL